MDDIFKTLSYNQMHGVESVLMNDENSSDEEMVEFIIEEYDLSKEQAEHAVSFRQLYRVNMFASGFSPIFGKEYCLKFDVKTRGYIKFDDF